MDLLPWGDPLPLSLGIVALGCFQGEFSTPQVSEETCVCGDMVPASCSLGLVTTSKQADQTLFPPSGRWEVWRGKGIFQGHTGYLSFYGNELSITESVQH